MSFYYRDVGLKHAQNPERFKVIWTDYSFPSCLQVGGVAGLAAWAGLTWLNSHDRSQYREETRRAAFRPNVEAPQENPPTHQSHLLPKEPDLSRPIPFTEFPVVTPPGDPWEDARTGHE